jgi:hypothetical protein
MGSYYHTNPFDLFELSLRVPQSYDNSASNRPSSGQPNERVDFYKIRPGETIRAVTQQNSNNTSAIRRQGWSGTSYSPEQLDSRFKGQEPGYYKQSRGFPGAPGQTSQFSYVDNFRSNPSGDLNGNLRANGNLRMSSPQRQRSITAANAFSVPHQVYSHQTQNKGPEVAGNLHSFSRPKQSSSFRAYQSENTVSTLAKNIEECRVQLNYVVKVTPEASFLLEIGSVIQRALQRLSQIPPEAGERYFRTLEKFAELFQTAALPTIRDGQIALACYQHRQNSPQTETNTRTSTVNSQSFNFSFAPKERFEETYISSDAKGIPTRGISMEFSQTNESSVPPRSSKGTICTDTEPSQHSQYSARSHCSASVLDSSQKNKVREESKTATKTKGRKRSTSEQQFSEDMEQQNVAFKSSRPSYGKTDIMEPPRVTNSRSSSEVVERPESNTFSNMNAARDMLLSRGKDFILQKKEELDSLVASIKRDIEKARLFMKRLDDAKHLCVQGISQMGRNFRQTENVLGENDAKMSNAKCCKCGFVYFFKFP